MTMRMPLFLALLATTLVGCDNHHPIAVGQTAWDRIELYSEASEPIAEIPVREGDRISAGTVMVRQLPQRLAAQLDQAAAGRDQAAARLAELKRGPRQELIEQAQARLNGSRSRLVNAEKQLQRIQELVPQKLATRADLDRARAENDSASAEVEAFQAELSSLLEGTTLEELQQAEAAYQQADAQLRELQVVIDRLTVTAPRPGIVDALPFEVGEKPPAGSIVAVMLVGEQPYARVYIPEPYRVHLTAGTSVPLQVDGIKQPVAGRVRYIASEAAFTPFFALTEHDRSRLSFLAEIDFENPGDTRIPAGIPVQADLSALDTETGND